ncbi:hypothetical protein H5410_060467 [Solanum commersonii]|uniref:Uncharacterized protein n=1 Tax=Solanum commersonii TaxID=4109 RepID=A0A9J5W556_SOLCO|nr:hypothetical protein H5410_060467 [Solanum commersonii]
MAKIKNLLLERRKRISFPTTISDLKQDINNLKDGIHHLKEMNIIIEIRLDNIESLKDLGNTSESSSYEGDSKDLYFLKTLNFGNNKEVFLQSLKVITSQKFILVNDITNQIILGVPIINDIFPRTFWDNKEISGTWNEKPFTLEFITKPFTRMINGLSSKLVLKKNQVNFIKGEINSIKIDNILQNPKLKDKIDILKNHFSIHICEDLLTDEENIEIFDQNDKKEVVLLLEQSDLR